MQYNYSSLLNRDAAPESHQVRPESLKTFEPSAIIIHSKYSSFLIG